MTDNKQSGPAQFQLKIVSVKMKIKFPCKMALQFNKKPITKEVASTEGSKFVFNEDFIIKGENTNENYQILANLFTDKGTRYTSGVMKLLGPELSRSQGERLIIPLAKCLDPDAFCQIKVEQVSTGAKSKLKLNRANSKILFNSTDKLEALVSDNKKINSEKYLIQETKSEVHSPPALLPTSEEGKLRDGAKTQIFKSFTRSPNSKFSYIKYITSPNQGLSGAVKNSNDFLAEEATSQRQSLVESEVIRQSYQKLKEKYKKQSELAKEQTHKRMLLEANQNNYKLQIMKLKLKCDTLEKQLAQKNDKVKTISLQLTEFQKKDIDFAYLKEQCFALQNKISMQENTIQTLTNDNESIKKMLSQKTKIKDETITGLRNQLEFALAKIEEQKHELDLQVKTKDAIILGKNNDLKMRSDTIDRQKQLIKELEDQAEAKLFEFEKSLTSQRNSLQLKIDDLKNKKTVIDKEKEELKIKNENLLEEIEKQKASFTALQYSKKLLSQEIASLGQEIIELKMTKERYLELQKENKALDQQFSAVKKSLELSVQNKQLNLNQLLSKHQEHKERHEKAKIQNEEKVKSLIVRTQELELSLETNKNALEKSNRAGDNLNKEVSNLKKQLQTVRDELKIAEKRVISLEGDTSNYSTKYQRETANLTFLLSKYKDEKSMLEKENDNLKQKNERLQESKTDLQRKEQSWKLRERHYEQRIEKEANKHKEIINKYETLLKENEASILQLNIKDESLTQEIKQLLKKAHDYELAEIKIREKEERSRKEVKFSQQRVLTLQTQLKAKIEELSLSSEKNRQVEFKLQEKQLQITKLREDFVQEHNKMEKQAQIIELLNKDIVKLQQTNSELQKHIVQKEEEEEQLRVDIKNSKQEIATEKIRANKIESNFDKFKENINDIIRIEFTRILNTPLATQKGSQKLRESQISNAKSQKSEKSKNKITYDAGQLASTLAEKLHETKNSLWKMVELNRAFRAQNSKLMEQLQSASNKHEFTKLELHRDIQQLEDEMNIIIDDKESEAQSYDNIMLQLNNKLKDKENTIKEMSIEIDQYNAIITGLRTDFQTNNDLNEKKVITLKASIVELNERIEYLNLNVACLQDKNHELEQKTIEMENEIILHKELLIKNQKISIDAKENQSKSLKELEALKKDFKAVQEAKEEYQIQLNTEREIKEKYIVMLEEQEKKCQKLNEFVTGLISQKEAAIKNEIQKSEEVNNLQNKLFESTQANEVLKEENQALKKRTEELKEEAKNVIKTVKSLEKQLAEEKSKHNRSLQKLKERETDVEIKKEYIHELEEKYRDLRDKNYKEIQQLSNQLEDKSSASSSMSKELTDKIIVMQLENKKYWENSLSLKQEIEDLNKQIHNKSDLIQQMITNIRKLQEEKTTLQEEISSKDFILNERVEQIQKLEEIIEDQKITLQNISNEFQSYQKQFDLNINELTNDYNFKIETISRENEQKLERSESEIQFVREKLKPLELEISKVLLQKKSLEIENQQTKKMYQEKLKKLESERLSSILSKNSEIKQISEEHKAILTKLHEKESEIRRLTLELEQIKLTTGRSQEFHSYSLEQSKNREKVLLKEIEGWKIKQQHTLNFKQTVLAMLYQNEVEVKKVIAATSKKMMQVCNKTDSDKVLSLLKGLENNVVNAMMAKINTS